jgi:hypothetical protein
MNNYNEEEAINGMMQKKQRCCLCGGKRSA